MGPPVRYMGEKNVKHRELQTIMVVFGGKQKSYLKNVLFTWDTL